MGENEWYYALGNLGYREQIDYDVYDTNGPSSGESGNGLGGRATPQTLAGYDILLYTCGDLGAYTISNGDYYNDPSNDIGVLSAWFQQGGKKGFFTGDDLIFNLSTSGSAALAFRNQYFGVQYIRNNLLPLIQNQTAPQVVPLAGNSVFTTPEAWVAYGVTWHQRLRRHRTTGSAERLAEFLTPAGVPGYTYARDAVQ